ncbi:MAG: 6-hydroxymethylpterin diphosphokinase MptE-like protein [Spirochaetales bacterium]
MNSRYLYSRYDPRKQTERFVEARIRAYHGSDGHHPQCVIVISEGLGYIEDACARLLPECELVSIHLSKTLSSPLTREGSHTLVLGRATGEDAQCSAAEFSESRFEALISHLDVSGLLVIEWEPSCVAFRHEYETARDAVERVVRRRAADTATVRRWGRLWIRNTLRNCTRGPLATQLPSFDRRPTLVVCPGPSALETVEALARSPRKPVIVAVASALELLSSFAIKPEIIVHTDAGFYSTLHFRDAWNTLSASMARFHLVMPLTAAPPPVPFRGNAHTTTVISGNSHVENTVLKAAGLSARSIPEAGTVTTTALRIASMVSEGPRFVSGLDLCFDDIRHHASPHAFDTFLAVNTDRFTTEVTSRWTRAMDTHPSRDTRIRRADNLDLYAEWFRSHRGEFASVRRVNPSEIDTGMQPASITQLLETVDSAGNEGAATASSRNSDEALDAATTPALSRKEVEAHLLIAAGVPRSGNSDPVFRRELARWLNVDNDSTAIREALSSLHDLPG